MKIYEDDKTVIYEDEKGNRWIKNKKTKERTYEPNSGNGSYHFDNRKKKDCRR